MGDPHNDTGHRPGAKAVAELLASPAARGKDGPQPRRLPAFGCKHGSGNFAVLDLGIVHRRADEIARRAGDSVTLAAPCFPLASNPDGSPYSVRLTGWLSMTSAFGLAWHLTFS